MAPNSAWAPGPCRSASSQPLKVVFENRGLDMEMSGVSRISIGQMSL